MIDSITEKFYDLKAIMNDLIPPLLKDMLVGATPVTLWFWDILPTSLAIISGGLSVWHLYHKGKIAAIDSKLKEKEYKEFKEKYEA
jgi:hypothetical protein